MKPRARRLSVAATMRARIADPPPKIFSFRIDQKPDPPSALKQCRAFLGDAAFVREAREFIGSNGHTLDSGALRELEAEVAAALGEKAPTQTPRDPRIPKDIKKDLR